MLNEIPALAAIPSLHRINPGGTGASLAQQAQASIEPFQGKQAIPQGECFLELQLFGGLLHAPADLFQKTRIAPLEECPQSFDRGMVFLASTGRCTRAETVAQLPTQAAGRERSM